MNIYLHELRTYRKSTITWTIALVMFSILFISMYPVLADDAKVFDQILGAFPEEFVKALGLSTLNLSTVLGFYSFVFAYVMLIGTIQAMNLGTSILSVEIREKTADFLLVKPVKRSKIVTSKLLAVLTSIIITDIIFTIAAKIMFDIVKTSDYEMKIFILITLTLFITQLVFIGLGMFVSVLFKKLKTVLPISLGFVFGFFIIDMLNETLDDVKLSYLTPFSYFNLEKIIETGKYDNNYLILSFILTFLLIGLSYVIYQKKDIHSI